MIKFALGIALGIVLSYGSSGDACDTRIRVLFTPDDYRAMTVPALPAPVPMRKQ